MAAKIWANAFAIALFAGAGCVARADIVDPSTVKPGYVGPETPYGETDAEKAAKKVVFDWNYQSIILEDPAGAAKRYISPNVCDHSHMVPKPAGKLCTNYDEWLADHMRRFRKRQPGQKVEIPLLASVNGEMVTMYGAGVDVFRVVDGKITDHWDASPPAAVTIREHAPGFKEWVWGPRKGPPPMLHDK